MIRLRAAVLIYMERSCRSTGRFLMEEVKNSKNFIEAFVEEDIGPGGQYEGMQVHTRFPPEPNGYLHIGHCKALCIDFGIAEEFGGITNLRMDDTNPAKEDSEYVEAIQDDIHWLGFDWGDRMFYGSDYFQQDYEFAVELIKKGLAYVCELTPEQFREYRGDINIPAKSPWRDRPMEESLDLFERMKNGEFPEGKYTLRAKIDLASGNFNMRDPVLYRIRYIEHHRQGTKWCIFPMYDFAHPIQDALEGITHSLCSLSPGRSSLPVSASTIRSCPSGSSASWWRKTTFPAGMIPECPPFAVSAAAAIPPVPSGTSPPASVSPKWIQPWTGPCWRAA